MSRQSPNLRPVSDHPHSMLLLFRQPIMFPIVVFSSSPTCFFATCTNSNVIDLITMKELFSEHQPPATIHHFLVVIVQWLQLFTCSKNMSQENIHYSFFHMWTQYKPIIVMIRACPSISITIMFFWYIVTWYHPLCKDARHSLKCDIYGLNRLRNRCYLYTKFP